MNRLISWDAWCIGIGEPIEYEKLDENEDVNETSDERLDDATDDGGVKQPVKNEYGGAEASMSNPNCRP